jgi:putative transposase
MKTIEFKLSLTISQQQTVDEWLAALKYVWNKGVEIIERFKSFNYYDKRFKATAPCCPIATYDRRSRQVLPSCPIGWMLADYTGLSYFQNEQEEWELVQVLMDEEKVLDKLVGARSPCGVFPVRLERDGKLVTNLTYFGIEPVFAHKRNQDKPWLTAVDRKFIGGTVKTLTDGWTAFLAGSRERPPKFKRKGERISTLIHNNTKPDATGRSPAPISGDKIRIPKIGWVRVKGLSKRWPQGLAFCPLKICRKASGYYLQLTGEVQDNKAVKPPSIQAVGLDPGIEAVFTDDAGRRVKVPDYLERDLKKLQQLQRKASRQWEANKDLPEWQRKNWRKTQDKVAKLHEKIARRGRAFNHFQSTKLVRIFNEIYLEDYRPSEMVGKVSPVDSGKLVVNKNDELTTIYDQNGRKVNRAINRATLRNRVGQLWQMIETKGGKRVLRVERSGTSSECPRCGHIKEKHIRVRVHRCEQCGYKAHRDHAAAEVIKKRGQEVRANGGIEEKEQKKSRNRRGKKASEGSEG